MTLVLRNNENVMSHVREIREPVAQFAQVLHGSSVLVNTYAT